MTYQHPAAADHIFEPLWLPDMLRATAGRTPGAVLIDFLGRTYTYAQILDSVRRAATGFRALGIGPGSTVGLLLPNTPHYVIAYYGALLAGARLANFSPLYTTAELRDQVTDSEVDAMVTLDVTALYPNIAPVLGTARLKRLVTGSVAEVLPPIKSALYRLFKRSERAPIPQNGFHTSWAELLAHPPLDWPAAPSPSEIALLQYTGGTTGTPKGAMLSHANLSINAQQVQAIDPDPAGEDRILGALPLFHIFANTCIMNRTVLRGGTMVLIPRFDAAQALAAIQRARITALPGVPTMYRALLDHPDFRRRDLSSIRICISGGAPLPQPTREAFATATGAALVEGYGLTESSGVVSVNPYATGGKPGTIGQPLPGTEVVLVSKDDPTQPVAPGEPGELTVAGPQIMCGYWNRDNGPASGTFIDGRLRTGDIVTQDEEGFLTVVDRLKDMIIVGGFKVFPSVVETAVYRHPAVREAIVIGIPDAYAGERPKAFVTLHPDAEATGQEITAFVNGAIGKHERLLATEIRDALPKTMIGKLSRKELVAEERARAGVS